MSDEAETCWLCQRPLGARVEYHHPVPKSRGGRETQGVHPICHRTLHVQFTNKELAAIGNDPDALRKDARLAPFLEWISGKDPDFHAPTRAKHR
ncbi:HNH endonuclease [Sphingomicrobium sediminis]|uniref:HNH endonuclease n=1 Tax=Sphingomicrobium sediminis TaxID=2950949 RepID=A0A9X2ELW3_9SPHN|nr:HNH endonuclease [Sphingomicrobium sediminis]MCM8557759.1 HNH endonuclease [Sphingomicrobium sediminis]